MKVWYYYGNQLWQLDSYTLAGQVQGCVWQRSHWLLLMPVLTSHEGPHLSELLLPAFCFLGLYVSPPTDCTSGLLFSLAALLF